MSGKRTLSAVALVALAALWTAAPAGAYIEAPFSLGKVIFDSTPH